MLFGYEIKSIHNFILLLVAISGLFCSGIYYIWNSGRNFNAVMTRLDNAEVAIRGLQDDSKGTRSLVVEVQGDIRLIKQGGDFQTKMLTDLTDNVKYLQRGSR